jgi:tripartite-type tricarboxylate transporter receptor subunit TctC
VPAGVPPEIVAKLNRDIADVTSIPEVKNRFAQQGVTTWTSSAADFNALLRSDAERFGKMFEKASK